MIKWQGAQKWKEKEKRTPEAVESLPVVAFSQQKQNIGPPLGLGTISQLLGPLLWYNNDSCIKQKESSYSSSSTCYEGSLALAFLSPSHICSIAKEHPSTPSFLIFPTQKTIYLPGPSREHTMNVAAGQLPEDIYTNMLLSWQAVLQRKFIAVGEWESKVIAKWQVCSFFFFFLFSLSTTLSSWLPPTCCIGKGTRWVERESGKVHVIVDL